MAEHRFGRRRTLLRGDSSAWRGKLWARLVCLAALCGMALQPAAAQPGSRAVSDDSGQFAINLPLDWTSGPMDPVVLAKVVPVAERPRMGGGASGLIAVGPGNSGHAPPMLFVAAVPLGRPSAEADPAQLAGTLREAPDAAPGLRVLQEGSAKVGRFPAHYVYALASDPGTGKALVTLMVFFAAGQTGFYAYGATPDDDPDRAHADLSTMSLIFETIQLSPPQVRRVPPPAAALRNAPDAQDPTASVFMVFAVPRTPNAQYAATGGTAFFISSDGTAVTNSHVVYEANVNPDYQLVALVNGEFYGASVVCASALTNNPWTDPSSPVAFQRDVAEIRLTPPPPNFPFATLHMPGGTPYGNPHQGPLPAFPALRFGRDPVVGQSVYFVGYGVSVSSAPFPASITGIVRTIETAHDGTRIFAMTLQGTAVGGDSGAPVLDSQGEVVGVLAWTSDPRHNFGFAMTRGALDPICR